MMKKGTWKPYVAFILLTEAVGALAGWLTQDGRAAYEHLAKSALNPPDLVFPIVWTVLFALMGIGAARIWLAPPSSERTRALRLFGLQLAFNFAWSFLFFNWQAFGWAFYWLVALWLLILWMICAYRRVDRTAALLQIPYLLWVAFAGYLNWAVWMLNR